MEAREYTKFPDLSIPSNEKTARDGSHSWKIQCSVSDEILIFSWASLIQAYTGDQQPVFRVAQKDVQVDLEHQAVAELHATCIRSSNDQWTGILMARTTSNSSKCALQLRYHSEISLYTLESCGYVPLMQLEQIALQLTRIWTTSLGPGFICNSTILSTANITPTQLEGPRLLHELLTFRSTPEAVGIEFRNLDGTVESFSFYTIDKLSTKLALQIQHYLHRGRSYMCQKTIIIPILMFQSPYLYITILAVLKAGAAFCPLDPDAPDDRIRFILQDVSASVVMTTGALEHRLAWTQDAYNVMIVDGIESGCFLEESTFLSWCSPTDLAYVMYTSGSTGLPKGVCISHTAATQSLLAHDRHIPNFSRFLQFAAPTFDVFVFEMFFTLLRGSTLVGCDRSELLNDLGKAIDLLEIDAAELTPTVVGGLLRKRDIVPNLRTLLTIGEMLTTPIIHEFGGSPEATGLLHGMYGPTEASIHCTIATNFQACSRVGIIGIPLDTVSAFIIEEGNGICSTSNDVKVLPVGQCGELAVGGYQLADGYLNRPDQNAASFIDSKKYGRLYRTGDKARLLIDGSLEFLGRISSGQVKLRGRRVELGEIEHAICQAEGVVTAVACVMERMLVAFCSVDRTSVSVQQVLNICRNWLPNFMIPADIVLLQDFPRLPSGKVDKRRLCFEYQNSRAKSGFVLSDAANHTEQKIIDCVQNVIGTTVGRSASLTAAGLDSLLAIRLSSELRMLGFNTDASSILMADTVQKIGELDNSPLTADSSTSSALYQQDKVRVMRDLGFRQLQKLSCDSNAFDIIPCTPVQIGLLAETSIDSRAYCNWIELELNLPSVSAELFKGSFGRLALRNEILRTGFLELEDSPEGFCQVIWRKFPDTCFSIVKEFSYLFSINSQERFLHPLKVQLRKLDDNDNRVLFHIHHALYDGWSWEQMISDLEGIIAGREPRSRPPYRKLVEYYLLPSTAIRVSKAREFWQKSLYDIMACSLPNLHGVIGIPQGVEVESLRMGVKQEELELLARKLEVSPQAFFQAAFSYLLSFYLGRTDIVFGLVLSGRTLPIGHIEDILGPFLSTVPFRMDVADSRTVRDLVRFAHKQTRQMLEHCILPLREIKKFYPQGPGKMLFDTLMVYQQTLSSNPEESNVRQVGAAEYLEYNLTIQIEPRSEYVSLKALYQTALLPKAQVEFLLKQLDQTVAMFIQDHSKPLAECRSGFSDNVLSIHNPIPHQQISHTTITSSLNRAFERAAGDLALEFYHLIEDNLVDVERLSYQALNNRSNRMAHYLLSLNVRPDQLVCIIMDKSVNLYISILAVLKAGAGYLPLTPDTPCYRVKNIMFEARVKVCITQSKLLKIFNFDKDLFVVAADETDFGSHPANNPVIAPKPSDLAYAVFTSGSTGVPKGVLITQGNLLSNLEALVDIYPSFMNSKILQSCSQAFDVSVFEITFAWYSGMCLCSASNDVLFRDIELSIRTMSITHLSLTPTVARLVDPRNVPSVRFLVTAGEAVTSKVFNTWASRGLYQGYGPSETTNICTVRVDVSSNDCINNIGPPLRNTSVFVCYNGTEFNPVPRGAIGELYFGGDQVGRGYLNMLELTSQRFICHPEYGRLYRSGDFGRLLSDGNLLFVGRQDDQVKIRGQRVELGELNSIVLRSPAVDDCATLLIEEGDSRTQDLVSFWIPRKGASGIFDVLSPDADIISETYRLFDSLVLCIPSYMVPTFLIPLSGLPVTPQGKIDKRKLVAAFRRLSPEYLETISRRMECPSKGEGEDWSPLASEIARAVAQVVDVSVTDIRLHTSFFSLGLDSISAIRLSKILRNNGRRGADVSSILRYPTASSLSKAIAREVHIRSLPDARSALANIFTEEFLDRTRYIFEQAGKGVCKVLPCTPLQEAMLFISDQKSGASYHNHTVFEVHGSMQLLQACWQSIVQRHEILRTSFVTTEDPRYPFAQVVLNNYEPKWTKIATDPSELETCLKDCLTSSVHITSNLEPAYRFTTIESLQHSFLLLSIHHALYDGVAISLLLADVERIYFGASLPPVVPFGSFLEQVVSLNLEEAGNFWKAQLDNFKPVPFPNLTSISASPGESGTNFSTLRTRLTIPLSLLENECKRRSVSQLALYQASWARLLGAYMGAHDICFGNVVSGRTISLEGIDSIIGPCFNTVPVRVRLTPEMTNLDLIESLHNINTESLIYQLTPLRLIQSGHNSSGARLFDTLFILQHPKTDLDRRIWSLHEETGDMEFPVVCEVTPIHSDESVEVKLHYCCSILLEEDVQRILEVFDGILKSCLSHPLNNITDLGYLDKDLLRCSIQLARERAAANVGLVDSEMTTEVLRSRHSKIPTVQDKEYDCDELVREVLSSFSDRQPGDIGRDTTIYQLGLDSINAAQIAAELRRRGRTVTAVDILEHPSLSLLSKYLRDSSIRTISSEPQFDFEAFERQHRESLISQLEISDKDLQCIRPCTPVQAGMIAEFLSSDGTVYFNHLVLELSKGTDMLKFSSAWALVMQKHDMLRTGFTALDSEDYSFAMVTYQSEAVSLPLYHADIESDGLQSLRRYRSICASSVLQSLDKPAWRLGFYTCQRKPSLVQFSAHHALYDAQSLQIILRDVAYAYNGSLTHALTPLNEIIDAILRGSSKTDAQEEFWKGICKDLVVTKFPILTPLRVESNVSRVASLICSKTRHELEESCKANGITMQVAGEAAWARVLAAYTGEPRVTFGLVLSGRTSSLVTGEAAFPCLATVPVSFEVHKGKAKLLLDIMRFNSSVLKQQFTPLSNVQRWTGHAGEPLFDTIFVYQKLTHKGIDHSSLWKVLDEEASADYSVSVELQTFRENELRFMVTFRDCVLPVEQAALLLEQLDAILGDTLDQTALELADTSSLPKKILSVMPPKEQFLPSEIDLLHQFVETQKQISPGKIALEFATNIHQGDVVKRTWTYEELNAQGNKVAHLLIRNRTVPGDLVGICFDKCAEASFAILGILKAGCAFVALDPNAPAARKSFIVGDSQLKCILTTIQYALELRSNVKCPIFPLDGSAYIDGLPLFSPVLPRNIMPSDVCYCLYTSGTTGTPKGCEISHESAVQAMLAFQRLFKGHWDRNSKFLQFAAFHFDVSVLEQFWSWSVGICVSSAPRDIVLEDIAGTIRKLEITHLDLTPSLARLLHPEDVPSLRRGIFITGGEQLKQEILDVWGQTGVIYNGYGPTEATIGCTMFPRVPALGRPSNIGPQFDNVGSYVFIPNTTVAVIRGAVGELCVSGKLLALGYLNRSELTREKFQWIAELKERVYHTGDLVRLLHDGSFEFLGRIDDQVKLRGQRLETGEINETIRTAIGASRDIATLVIQHQKQQKAQLVSFIALENAQRTEKNVDLRVEPIEGTLRRRIEDICRAKLPGYMIPTYFIGVNRLPLSTNNKADSKQLRELFNSIIIEDLLTLSESKNGENIPLSGRELELAKVLSKAANVGMDSIQINSNIFELGLDSISVIRLARLLKGAGFKNANASLIMKNPSLFRLSKVLNRRQAIHSNLGGYTRAAMQTIAAFSHKHAFTICKDLCVSLDDIESISPCTPLQEAIISRSLNHGHGLYFGAFYFKLSSCVDVQKLKDAWTRTAERSQILRTRFSLTSDGYAQVAMRNQPFSWHEMSGSGELEIEDVTEEKYLTWLQRTIDLRTTPFEVVVVHYSSVSIMCLHIFHALYDGNSLPRLLTMAKMEYAGLQNIDYGLPFQQALAYGPLCQNKEAKAFWVQHLLGAHDNLTFPPVSELTDHESLVTAEIVEPKLEAIRRALKTSYQSLIQACWTSVLRSYSTDSVTIGLVVSGRFLDVDGIENTIGPLFNTIPFNMSFRETDTWASLVEKCHIFNTGVVPFQHTPLRDIMKWCKATNNPLFETLFVFQKDQDGAEADSPNFWTLLRSKPQVDFPLAFEAHHKTDGTLKITIAAQRLICGDDTSEVLLAKFAEALRQTISDPQSIAFKSPSIPLHLTNPSTPWPPFMPDSRKPTVDFTWSTEAQSIRREIAELAQVDFMSISETSSIFELGLDSIDAIRLSSRLKARGIYLQVGGIMRNPTIYMMMQETCTPLAMSEQPTRQDKFSLYEKQLRQWSQYTLVDTANAEEVLPTTPLQEAMIAAMAGSDYALYFNHDIMRLGDHVNLDRLTTAWEAVFTNTPILRTTFNEVCDPNIPFSYAQITYRARKLEWSIVNLPLDGDLQATFDDCIVTARRKAAKGTLLSISVVIRDSARYLILSIAHALYDGWSLGLLHEDVFTAYYGHYSQRPSYKELIAEILEPASEAEIFWQDNLSGVKPSCFEILEQGDATLEVRRGELQSSLTVDELNAFCRAQRVTLQALGQTVWAFILASYTKALDVVFGTVLSGRDTEASTKLMFPTANTVAVRAILHGTRGEMLRYMQKNMSDIRQYQHYPLRKAQAAAKLVGRRLFDTLFIYQKRPGRSTSHCGNSLYQSIGGPSSVEYPVCVEMELANNALVWRTACKDGVLFNISTDKLHQQIDFVLREIVHSPRSAAVYFTDVGTQVCCLPPFSSVSDAAPLEVNSNKKMGGDKKGTQWSDLGLTLREAMSTVSKVPELEISKDVTIFHLGLDSISAIKVSSLLRKHSIRLSAQDIIRESTIEKMVNFLEKEIPHVDNHAVSSKDVLAKLLESIDVEFLLSRYGISMENVQEFMPASAGQVYMVSAWQNSKGSLFYSSFSYRSTVPLTPERLDDAWQKLVKESPILRTIFVATESRDLPLLQVVLRNARNQVIWLDGDDIFPEDDHFLISPPVQLYVRQQAYKTLLQLQIHHALYDGVSLPILLRRLQAIYTCPTLKIGRTSSHSDFIALTRAHPSQRQQFWSTYLGSTSYPLLQPSRSSRTTARRRVSLFRPSVFHNALTRLTAFARIRGLSLPSIFIASYAKLHARLLQPPLSPASDIVFGIYHANRSLSIPDGDGDGSFSALAAPTLNLLPLRIRSPLDTPISRLALEIQTDIAEIARPVNASVGLWEVEQWTGVKIDCFINFLSLPDESDKDTRANTDNAWWAPVDQGWNERRVQVVNIDQCHFSEPGILKGNLVNDVYLPSIDIEAKFCNGNLDVGLFFPEELLSLRDADILMDELGEFLEGVCEGK